MAYYALYKWYAPWSKHYIEDKIYWYKEYVLKTEEQRIADKAKRSRDARTAMATLSMAKEMLGDKSNYYMNW